MLAVLAWLQTASVLNLRGALGRVHAQLAGHYFRQF